MSGETSSPRQRKTILLVEDEEPLLALFRGILELGGYNVLYTRDGEVAMRVCEEHSTEIDLLCSDVVMPGLNGADLSQWINTRWPHIKILLFSGHPASEPLLEGLDAMKDRIRFLRKPITQDVLLRTVRTMLG